VQKSAGQNSPAVNLLAYRDAIREFHSVQELPAYPASPMKIVKNDLAEHSAGFHPAIGIRCS
jgi:hypothetical protein